MFSHGSPKVTYPTFFFQSFEDFEELSVVATNNQVTSDQENDDTPPPLPPPRSHSLTIAQKPLPLIPNSESVHEDFLTCNERDMVNNLVNLEKSKQYEISKDRPLPPLPKDSLEKVHEATSSGDSGASSSDEDELIEENDSDQNGDDSEEDNSDNIESSVLDDTTITSSSSSAMTSTSTATSTTLTTTTSATATAANSNTSTLESNRGGEKFDANATLPPVPNGVDSNSNSAGEEAVSSPERGQ